MSALNAVTTPEDRSLDINIVSRIVRQRKKWIVLGTVIGIVLGVAFLLIAPTRYTATAQVSITAQGSEPVPEGRALSSLVDMATERQLASSALTTEQAAEALGAGWRVVELRDGLNVSVVPSSTVLRVTFTSTSRQRAIDGADALARAYLMVRTHLVAERAEEMTARIDERITEYEKELRILRSFGGEGNNQATVREESITAGILALQQRRATWSDLNIQSGQLISPARSSELVVTPVLWKVLALGVLSGLFLGFLMAAVRHALDREASHPDDLEELLNVRLLRPQAPVGDPTRWDAAATLAHHGRTGEEPLVALVDERFVDAQAAATALANEGATTTIGLHGDRSELLHSLQGLGHAVLIVPTTWKRTALIELQDDVESMGTRMIGVVAVDPRSGRLRTAGK